MDTLRILLFDANPFEDLKLDEEVRAIDRGLQSTRFRDSIQLHQARAARAADLISMLGRHKPHVVHFSGHGVRDKAGEAPAGARDFIAGDGVAEGQLLLVGENGAPQPVSQEALSELFAVRRDRIRLVVLNACFTRSQAEAICKVIDCVVGTNQAIRDDAARVFSERFYRTLGDGGSVQQAFDDARVELKLQGIPESNTPVLMTRPGVDPSQVFLTGTEAPASPSPAPISVADRFSSAIRRAPRRWAVGALLGAVALILLAAFAPWGGASAPPGPDGTANPAVADGKPANPRETRKLIDLKFSRQTTRIEQIIDCGFPPRFSTWKLVEGHDAASRLGVLLTPEGNQLRVTATEKQIPGMVVHLDVKIEVRASDRPIAPEGT